MPDSGQDKNPQVKIQKEMGTVMKKKMNYCRIWLKNLSVRKSGDPPSIHKKLLKTSQNLLWGVFKKEKLEKVVMYTLTPKNLENVEKTLVNPEIWRKISHKTKSVDLRL